MEAAHNGDVEDARLLLDSGASVDAKTLGKTALDVALTPGRTRIAEKSQVADLLRSRGAKSAQAQTSDHPVRAAASSAPVGGGGGRQAIPVPVPTAFEDKQAEALAQQGRGPQDSESAWKAAEKDGTPTAYLDFYRSFPQSPHIKAVTGTLRGRYWFRMHFEWERDQSPWEGVVVSVEGLNVAMNLPLEDAKRLGVIKVGPAAPGVKFSTEGVTFNYVYFEPTGGGVLAHDGQMIAPRDFLNSTIVLSADEQRLLAWDNGKATEASQPSQQPTIKEGADGNYPCGAACPKPR